MITWFAGGNSNSLEVVSPMNRITGEPIELATVEATVTDDETGLEIDGVTQPITLEKIDGLPKFAAALPKEAADYLYDGQALTARIIFSGHGDNEDAEAFETIQVVEPRTA